MQRLLPRPARAKKLIKAYLKFVRARNARHKSLRRRSRRSRGGGQTRRLPHGVPSPDVPFDSEGESTDIDLSDTESNLGSDFSDSGSVSSAEGLSSTDSMPGLATVVDSDSEVDFEMLSSSSSSSDSGMWGDDETDGGEVSGDSSDSEGEELRIPGDHPSRMGRYVRLALQDMYESRYEQPRDALPRGPAYLPHVLLLQKHERPDKFREDLRVDPHTFDRLVEKISSDSVFQNNSPNSQLPIDQQLAITLYRFGHNGNAAGLQNVANWAGVAKGTVLLATRRVMTAILRPGFMKEAVRYPTPEEKEAAKRWVHAHSCRAWRDGWCLVDGTLIPLYDRPFWYGESYFDRKCNYSLNIQVVSLPNLRIIDFGYGFTGSTHDSMAWEGTRIAQEAEDVFEGEEFIWADSAYPVRATA